MATELRRLAGRPRACHQGPAGRTIAGLGEAALGAPWATGICRGRQAQSTQQLCGVGNAREVSACGDGRDRHGALAPPPSLEGLNDWGEAPSVDPLLECLFQTLEACGGFGDRPPIRLEDELVGGRRTADCREPAAMCGAPLGRARRAKGLAQEQGFQALRRSFEVTEAILTGATQLAHGCGIALGDVDGGEVARTHPPGQWAGIAAVGFDPGPGFFRHH